MSVSLTPVRCPCCATPQVAIEDAAWCLGFVGHWETAIRKADPNLELGVGKNFLTNQTRQDVIIACNNVIPAAVLMREHCLAKQVRASECRKLSWSVGTGGEDVRHTELFVSYRSEGR